MVGLQSLFFNKPYTVVHQFQLSTFQPMTKHWQTKGTIIAILSAWVQACPAVTEVRGVMGLADRDYMRPKQMARESLRVERRPRLRDRLLFALWQTWRRLQGHPAGR